MIMITIIFQFTRDWLPKAMKQLGIYSLQKGFFVLSTVTWLATACFITDCPRRRGKKNSYSENVLRSHNAELRQVLFILTYFKTSNYLNLIKVLYIYIYSLCKLLQIISIACTFTVFLVWSITWTGKPSVVCAVSNLSLLWRGFMLLHRLWMPST